MVSRNPTKKKKKTTNSLIDLVSRNPTKMKKKTTNSLIDMVSRNPAKKSIEFDLLGFNIRPQLTNHLFTWLIAIESIITWDENLKISISAKYSLGSCLCSGSNRSNMLTRQQQLKQLFTPLDNDWLKQLLTWQQLKHHISSLPDHIRSNFLPECNWIDCLAAIEASYQKFTWSH